MESGSVSINEEKGNSVRCSLSFSCRANKSYSQLLNSNGMSVSSVQIGLQCLYSRPSGFNPPPRPRHFIFPFSLTLVSAFVIICGAQWALLIPDIIFKDIIWKGEIKESNAIYNPPFFSSPVFATTTQQSVNHLDLLNTCDDYLEMIMMIPERALWHSDDDTHLWCRSLSRW